MTTPPPRVHRFLAELRRRRVLRVAGIYAAAGFVVLEAVDLLAPVLLLPVWAYRLVGGIVVLGFPVAMAAAWVFDVTPSGLRRTADDDGTVHASVSVPQASAALALALVVVGVVAMAGWRLFGPGDAFAETAAIAVLPLDNLSADPDDEFFALGLTDEILTQLHHVSAMRITSRTSVMPYRGTDKNVRTIAEELGVRYLIEGSAQALGDRVRINLQLIDASTDAHLWADTFERSRSDLFAVQAEIAGRVARSVHVRLQPDERRRLAAQPTQHAGAYAWFLRARAHALEGWHGGNRREAWPLATEAYKRAVELDPTYALAHAELAMHLNRTMWLGIGQDDDELLRLAQASLERAVELAPDAPRTLLAQAHKTYHVDNDWTRAVAELERVEALLPEDHDLLFMLGFSHRRVARFEDAVATLERSLALDPLNWQLYYEIRQTHLRMRRYRDAEDVARRSARAGLEDATALQLELAVARGDVAEERRLVGELVAERGEDAFVLRQWYLEIHSGDFEAALAALDRETKAVQWADGLRVVTLLMVGDTLRARPLAEKWLPSHRERFDTNPSWNNRRNLAHAYIGTGRVAEALSLLREHLDRPWPQPDIDRWAGPNRVLWDAARSFGIAWAYDRSVFDDVFEMWERLLEMDEYPLLTGVELRTNHGWDVVRDHPRFQLIQARADSIDRALGWDPTPTWTGAP